MAAGDQMRRTFWSALKKKTERWFGMESSRASGNWSPNLKLRTKFIPASQTRFNQERAKLLTHNLGCENSRRRARPARLTILPTLFLPDTTPILPAAGGHALTC